MTEHQIQEPRSGQHLTSTSITSRSEAFHECNNEQPFERSETQRCSGSNSILLNSFWLIVPITLLTAVLLVIILVYRTEPGSGRASHFGPNPNIFDEWAYYVDVDSTKLVFLASWTSSVAPMLIGPAIGLTAFWVAEHLMKDCANDDTTKLPTAYQLHLILRLTGGSPWACFWDIIRYRFGWKAKTTPCSVILSSLTWVAILAILASGLVLASDTWLHIATKMTKVVNFSILPNHQAMYGFTALPSCLVTNNSFAAIDGSNTDCTLASGIGHAMLVDQRAVTQTITNMSSDTTVLQIPAGNLTYISVPLSRIDATHDFIAQTYGVEGLCYPASRSCQLANNKGNVTFDCGNGAFRALGNTFSGNGIGLATQFFKCSNLSDSYDSKTLQQIYGITNPFHVMGAISTATTSHSKLNTDPETVRYGNGIAAIFHCEFRVVEIEYLSTFSQGARQAQLIQSQPSNETIANMFVSSLTQAFFWRTPVSTAMNLASLDVSNAIELADNYRLAMSNALLSGGTASIQRIPSLKAQVRQEALVAKVPISALYCLVASNLVLVVLGVILTIMASRTSRDGRDAQSYLTVARIVAQLFENGRTPSDPARDIKHSYEEYRDRRDRTANPVKIAIDRNSRGGFDFEHVPLRDPACSSWEQYEDESQDIRRSRIYSLLSHHGPGEEGFHSQIDPTRFPRHSYYRNSLGSGGHLEV